MSQPHRNSERSSSNRVSKHRSRWSPRSRCVTNYNYYNKWYHVPSKWTYVYWKNSQRPPRKLPQQEPPRPPSPFSGTEEFRLRKIQQTSDMIKKALLMPQDSDDPNAQEPTVVEQMHTQSINYDGNKNKSKINPNQTKLTKKASHYNVEEIQKKIITHISKLSHGKKKNLICARSSGYDVAIRQIQKQKRVELSQVLRNMCSNHTVENSSAINSIIPDFGIDIESLPLDVIQELSTTLDLNFDDYIDCIDIGGSLDSTDVSVNQMSTTDNEENVIIKTEPINDQLYDSGSISNSISFMDTVIKEEMCLDLQLNSEVESDPIINSNNVGNIKLESRKDDIKSVQSQTDSIPTNFMSTQTDLPIHDLIKMEFKKNINTWEEAVDAMLHIDKEVKRLTQLRQSIFINLQNRMKTSNQGEQKSKKGPSKNNSSPKTSRNMNVFNRYPKSDLVAYKKPLEFDKCLTKILIIKTVDDTILAATEDGKILYINASDGTTRAVLPVSQAPITSISTFATKSQNQHLMVGSREPQLREFLLSSREHLRTIELRGCVQCLEQAWDYLFIGTTRGDLLRYSLKKSKIEFEEIISDESVFVLKATQEGPRYVLLVGTRKSAVCVRDALTGLILRTMERIVVPTVYTLLLESSMVYCGTTFHDILVFSFHDGSLLHKYQASNCTGITCMKIVGDLLFASSHNGNIYVYNVKTHKEVGVIQGPGGAILSMEVLKNIVIVGTMPVNFKSILIPQYILDHLENTI